MSTLLTLGSRDHRKLLTVDGRIAFIGGLCIGDDWLGDPARQVPAWRDTGLEIRGPAVAEAELAFAGAWARWGLLWVALGVLLVSLATPLASETVRQKWFDFPRTIGLMVLPPFFDTSEESRPYFVRLRALRDKALRDGLYSCAGIAARNRDVDSGASERIDGCARPRPQTLVEVECRDHAIGVGEHPRVLEV